MRRLPPGSARADAEWLLAHVLGVRRAQLESQADQLLTESMAVRFDQLLERRRRGEPLAYVIGEWEFWSLPLSVTPDVLIPRPDTELLVEWAIELMKSPSFPRKRESRPQLADLGTGSGAIALALAHEMPTARVVASDVSQAALNVAANNASKLALSNIEFHQAEFVAALDSRFRGNPPPSYLPPQAGEGDTRFRGNDGEFDLIVSNPPYIAEDDPHLVDLADEPVLALTAGPDGLTHLRTIISQSLARLTPDGWLLVEHGYDQAAAVRELFEQAGFTDVQTRRDLAGHERATGGRRA